MANSGPMNEFQAASLSEKLEAILANQKAMLLDMYDRKAHVALGYVSFREYCEDRLGMAWEDVLAIAGRGVE